MAVAVPHEVGAAVADLRQVEAVAVDTGGRHGRTHAADLWMLFRIGVDPCVRELHRLAHSEGKPFG